MIKKAIDLSGMVWFKAFKTMLVIAAILGILFAIYLAYIKPNYNPIRTTTQKAEEITNTEITNHYGIFHIKIGWFEFGI